MRKTIGILGWILLAIVAGVGSVFLWPYVGMGMIFIIPVAVIATVIRSAYRELVLGKMDHRVHPGTMRVKRYPKKLMRVRYPFTINSGDEESPG